jgi:malonyl-CoA O-methyltransferase
MRLSPVSADRRSPSAADPGALDARAVRRAFARAAATYDASAVLQREVGTRMATRLDVTRLVPALILDAGCGSGAALPELASRYPASGRVALDLALPMLDLVRQGIERRSLLTRLLGSVKGLPAPAAPPLLVCGDIAALPFAVGAFDLVWSNLALQWVNDLPRSLAELHRVLKVGGLVTFTTFGPDTLRELRAAFANVDRHTHVSRFIDMHDVGDLLLQAGFADPVMDMEYLTLTYADADAMLRDLKAIGATNATQGRPRGLMGRARWERTRSALDAMRKEGRVPATFEVIYGHAWKAMPTRTADGHAIVRVEVPKRGGGKSDA